MFVVQVVFFTAMRVVLTLSSSSLFSLVGRSFCELGVDFGIEMSGVGSPKMSGVSCFVRK